MGFLPRPTYLDILGVGSSNHLTGKPSATLVCKELFCRFIRKCTDLGYLPGFCVAALDMLNGELSFPQDLKEGTQKTQNREDCGVL